MNFFSSCVCCSLLTASIGLGVISTVLYIVAFALELWWILDADESLPTPAYILTAGYILMCLMSLLMLLSLRTKWPKVLLGWVLLMILYIFPEAGLVLFMVIYHWNGNTFAIIEVTLWLIRIFSNMCSIVTVQSLWSTWQDEKNMLQSLHELAITGAVDSSGISDHQLGIPGNHKIRTSMRLAPGQNINNNLGYNNPAFSNSIQQINEYKKPYHNQLNLVKRSASTASQFVTSSQRSLPNIYSSQRVNFPFYQKFSVSKDEFNPGVMFNQFPHPGYSSQLDLPSFGLDPDAPVFIQRGYGPGGLPVNIYRGNSKRDKLAGETIEWYRPRSLGNLHQLDRQGNKHVDSVSMLSERYNTGSYINHYHKDRWKSEGWLNKGFADDQLEEGTGHQFRTHDLGSRQSLGQISAFSDNPDKYRDIAL